MKVAVGNVAEDLGELLLPAVEGFAAKGYYVIGRHYQWRIQAFVDRLHGV